MRDPVATVSNPHPASPVVATAAVPVALSLALFLFVFLFARHQQRTNTCAPPGPPTDEWQLQTTSPFSIRVPPGFVAFALIRQMGRWSKGTSELGYTYGSRHGHGPSTSCVEIIHDQPVSFEYSMTPAGRHRVYAHWNPKAPTDARSLLDFWAEFDRPEDLALFASSLRTVVLRPDAIAQLRRQRS